AEGTTVAQLVERFALPLRLVHLVLIDGNFVPPGERANRVLKDGEILAIWPPVAGG
ncbi:MAG: MoaD/ThiS family protein, partial [Rhodocyclales bacterium]|nr:MoaD/ThiS family protein [Rhodocyclales bacterium]MBI5901515.1 MoaD/ThiS family protein [Rhodocyclales bacterium]